MVLGTFKFHTAGKYSGLNLSIGNVVRKRLISGSSSYVQLSSASMHTYFIDSEPVPMRVLAIC
jgi:hypothetical protein